MNHAGSEKVGASFVASLSSLHGSINLARKAIDLRDNIITTMQEKAKVSDRTIIELQTKNENLTTYLKLLNQTLEFLISKDIPASSNRYTALNRSFQVDCVFCNEQKLVLWKLLPSNSEHSTKQSHSQLARQIKRFVGKGKPSFGDITVHAESVAENESRKRQRLEDEDPFTAAGTVVTSDSRPTAGVGSVTSTTTTNSTGTTGVIAGSTTSSTVSSLPLNHTVSSKCALPLDHVSTESAPPPKKTFQTTSETATLAASTGPLSRIDTAAAVGSVMSLQANPDQIKAWSLEKTLATTHSAPGNTSGTQKPASTAHVSASFTVPQSSYGANTNNTTSNSNGAPQSSQVQGYMQRNYGIKPSAAAKPLPPTAQQMKELLRGVQVAGSSAIPTNTVFASGNNARAALPVVPLSAAAQALAAQAHLYAAAGASNAVAANSSASSTNNYHSVSHTSQQRASVQPLPLPLPLPLPVSATASRASSGVAGTASNTYAPNAYVPLPLPLPIPLPAPMPLPVSTHAPVQGTTPVATAKPVSLPLALPLPIPTISAAGDAGTVPPATAQVTVGVSSVVPPSVPSPTEHTTSPAILPVEPTVPAAAPAVIPAVIPVAVPAEMASPPRTATTTFGSSAVKTSPRGAPAAPFAKDTFDYSKNPSVIVLNKYGNSFGEDWEPKVFGKKVPQDTSDLVSVASSGAGRSASKKGRPSFTKTPATSSPTYVDLVAEDGSDSYFGTASSLPAALAAPTSTTTTGRSSTDTTTTSARNTSTTTSSRATVYNTDSASTTTANLSAMNASGNQHLPAPQPWHRPSDANLRPLVVRSMIMRTKDFDKNKTDSKWVSARQKGCEVLEAMHYFECTTREAYTANVGVNVKL